MAWSVMTPDEQRAAVLDGIAHGPMRLEYSKHGSYVGTGRFSLRIERDDQELRDAIQARFARAIADTKR